LSGVEVTRTGDAPPLTAHLWQRIPIGALEDAARRWEYEFKVEWAKTVASSSAPTARTLRPEHAERHKRFQKGSEPERQDRSLTLARVAKVYVETLGESKQVEAMRKALDELGEYYTEKSIPKLIRQAREGDFLTATRRGRPGGQLTNNARAVLGMPTLDDAMTAWERATPDQRAAALEREQRREELHAALVADRRAGKIDAETFAQRGLEIDLAILDETA
jgi:hypothetical protein